MYPHWFLLVRSATLVLFLFGCCRSSLGEPGYEELCQQGRKHLLAGDYVEAQRSYSQAVSADSERSLAHVGQALALRAIKQYDRAVEAASRAIEKDPNDAAALVIRGTAYHAQMQRELAKADFEKAIELAPTDACAYAELGRIYMDENDEKRALYYLSKAVDLNGDDHLTRVVRAKCYRLQGHFGKAARDLEQAIRVQPESAPYHFLLAQVHFDNRHYELATKPAATAIELSEKLTAAYVLHGAALYHQGLHQEALPLLQRAKKDAPMDAGAFLWLGKTLLELGKTEEATVEIQRALTIDDAYIAAYRALADVCERSERPDDAVAMREKAKTLEDELHKADILDQIVALDTGPSRIAETDQFDPATLSSESLQSQVPSVDLLTEKVLVIAEELRNQLRPKQRDLKVCEAASVVPEPCAQADEVYRRSVNLLESGDFEVAAVGFQEAETRYKAALEAFEEKASGDHTVWLDWAQQRADKVTEDSQLTTFLTTMGEVYSRLDDKPQYAQMMDRLDARFQAAGIMDPVGSADLLFQVAEVRKRCGDRQGAQAVIKEATSFCEGITAMGAKSIRLARCAGTSIRYGASDQWASTMGEAIRVAQQAGYRRDEAKRHMLYVHCVAYAEAGAAKPADVYAQSLADLAKRTLRNSQIYACTANAWAALGAARGDQNSPETRRLMENNYVAATIRLTSISDKSNEPYVRLLLNEADHCVGANERAWAGATCLASPAMRILAMRRVLREECEDGHLALARQMFPYVPPGPGTIRPVCQLAEAEARFGDRTFVSLKKWVEDLPTKADRAAAMAGIALGVKAGRLTSTHEADTIASTGQSSNNQAVGPNVEETDDRTVVSLEKASLQAPDDAEAREVFDKTAAADASWWLEKAIALTNASDDPCTRACLWRLIARTQWKLGDTDSYRLAVDKARHCTIAMWNRILQGRLPEEPRLHNTFEWSHVARRNDLEMTEITGMLRVLLDLEELQNEAGDSEEAVETLLLALKCVELMPKNESFVKEVSPRCPAAWLMRIAGRLTLLGRHDLAGQMLADGPWFPYHGDHMERTYLLSLAAAESNDLAKLEELELTAREWANRVKSPSCWTGAARVNAFLAMVAARRGDQNRYRKAAMRVGGYVNLRYGGASKAVFLDLAEAAAAAGQPDAALQFVKRADARDAAEDLALLAIAEKMVRFGRVAAAQEIVQDIYDDYSLVRSRYIVAEAEAGAPSASLSTLYLKAEKLSDPSQKAAVLAGIAAGLQGS